MGIHKQHISSITNKLSTLYEAVQKHESYILLEIRQLLNTANKTMRNHLLQFLNRIWVDKIRVLNNIRESNTSQFDSSSLSRPIYLKIR